MILLVLHHPEGQGVSDLHPQEQKAPSQRSGAANEGRSFGIECVSFTRSEGMPSTRLLGAGGRCRDY